MSSLLSPVPLQIPVDSNGKSINVPWLNWFQLLQNIVSALTTSGATSNRPTSNLWIGRTYYNSQTTKLDVIVSLNPVTWKSATLS